MWNVQFEVEVRLFCYLFFVDMRVYVHVLFFVGHSGHSLKKRLVVCALFSILQVSCFFESIHVQKREEVHALNHARHTE